MSGALVASALLVTSCDGGGIADNSLGARSRAMSLWSPAGYATCSRADHDRYVVAGPDGKLYPTWHPAVDPVKGCSYGHEHGRDPRGSALYQAIGEVPFGVAGEALSIWDSGRALPEDHAAQKVEWQNGVMLQQEVAGQREDIGVRCDFLVKFHQAVPGDPSTGNPTELVYHVRCDDGTEIHATTLVRADQPATIATGDGARLAFFDPRFGLVTPVRVVDADPQSASQMLMDLCGQDVTGGDGAHSGGCEAFPTLRERRRVYFNQTGIYNVGGPTVWYTDPFGAHAAPKPFPGSIRQVIAPVTNDRGFALASQVFEGGSVPVSQP
ncbi:MAG TPA: hypothetical protein VGP80_04675 [Gemmatimonadales bacterium]|nr:hypothetical protein [Gemmatimonadales bacterium]